MIWLVLGGFVLVIVVVGAIAAWLELRDQPDTSPGAEAEGDGIRAYIGEPDYQLASMVSSYGFLSTSSTRTDGKLFDVLKHRELPADKRFICVNPSSIDDQQAFKKELKRARNVVNQRVRNQQKSKRPADIDNLRVPDDLELVQEMADAISRPEPQVRYKKAD